MTFKRPIIKAAVGGIVYNLFFSRPLPKMFFRKRRKIPSSKRIGLTTTVVQGLLPKVVVEKLFKNISFETRNVWNVLKVGL